MRNLCFFMHTIDIFCHFAIISQQVIAVMRHREKCPKIDIKIDKTLAGCCSTCLRRSGITVGRGYVVSGTILPKTDKILLW